MPTGLSEADIKRNALSAFLDFHRRSADGSFRVVKASLEGTPLEVARELDSFTERDVECRRAPDGWVCTIRHVHLSRTQKGMPRIFEYKAGDDSTQARYDCKPAT